MEYNLKKHINKKIKYIYTYSVMLLILLLILIAPQINNDIYAKSKFVPAKINENTGTFQKTNFEKKVNEIFKEIQNFSIYKSNEEANKKELTVMDTSGASVALPRVEYPTRKTSLAREGKMYEPGQIEKIENPSTSYGVGDLAKDSDIFCAGKGVRITSGRGELNSYATNMSEFNGSALSQAQSGADALSATGASKKSTQRYKSYIRQYLSGSGARYSETGNGFSVYGDDKEAIASAAKSYADSKMRIEDVRREVYGNNRMNQQSRINDPIHPRYQDADSQLPDNTPGYIRGKNTYEYELAYKMQGTTPEIGDKPKRTVEFTPENVNPKIFYAAADVYSIGDRKANDYILNPYKKKETVGSDFAGANQTYLWTNSEHNFNAQLTGQRAPHNEPNVDGSGASGLAAEAKDFAEYWKALVEFARTRGKNNLPNQKVFHAKKNAKKITFSSVQDKPSYLPDEIPLKAPDIVYEPRFVEANGVKPEETKELKFRSGSQTYRVGPYSLDYVNMGGRNHFNENKHMWYSTITGMKLYGEYVPGTGPAAERNSNLPETNNVNSARNNFEKAKLANLKAREETSTTIADLYETLDQLRDKVKSNNNKEAFNEFQELADLAKSMMEGVDKFRKASGKPEDLTKAVDELKEVKNNVQHIISLDKHKNLEKVDATLKRKTNELFNACVKKIEEEVALQLGLIKSEKLLTQSEENYTKRIQEVEKDRKKAEQKEKDKEDEKLGNINFDEYMQQNGSKLNNAKKKLNSAKLVSENFKIGYYVPQNVTKLGTKPQAYRTAAVNTNLIPLNTRFTIEGIKGEFIASDSINSNKENVILIAVNSNVEKANLKETIAKVKIVEIDNRETTEINAKKQDAKTKNMQYTSEKNKGNHSSSGRSFDDNTNNKNSNNEAFRKSQREYEEIRKRDDNSAYNKALKEYQEYLKQADAYKKDLNQSAEGFREFQNSYGQDFVSSTANSNSIGEVTAGDNNTPSTGNTGNNTGNTGNNNNNNGSGGSTTSTGRQNQYIEHDKIENDFDVKTDVPFPEIQNWNLVIDGVEKKDRKEYFPYPGETFYFEIPYDPNLLQLKAIEVEFTKMVFAGEIRFYKGTNAEYKINVNDRISNNSSVSGGNISVGDVQYTLNAQKEDQGIQPMSAYTTAKWMDKDILLLYQDKPKPSEPEKKLAKFKVPIGGFVWEDEKTGDKHVDNNNVYDDNEKKLENIEVKVYRVIGEKDGEGIKNIVEKQQAILYKSGTDEEFNGKIYTNKDGEWGPFEFQHIGFNETEAKKYDPNKYKVALEVVYLYDGVQYQPVVPLANVQNATVEQSVNQYRKASTEEREKFFKSSMVFENFNNRVEYNKKFAEISGFSEINDNGETTGLANATANDNKRTGENEKLNYKKADAKNGEQRIVSEYITEFPGANTAAKSTRFMTASTLNIGLNYMFDEDMTTSDADTEIQSGSEDKSKVILRAKPYMTKINMGLIKREKLNTSLTKDLVSALVVVNKKAYEYKYDLAYKLAEGNATPEQLQKWLTQELKSSGQELQYKLDIYKTDYIYRTEIYKNDAITENSELIYKGIEKEVELERVLDDVSNEGYTEDTRKADVFLTYRISLYNSSNSDTVYFTNIKDYFSEDLDPVLNNISKVIEKDPEKIDQNVGPAPTTPGDGNVITIHSPKYKVYKDAFDLEDQVNFKDGSFKDFKWEKQDIYANNFRKMEMIDENPELIVPAGGRADVYTTYRVKRNGDELGLKNSVKLGKYANVAEIAGFAGYDGESGLAVGKVDMNSAPDNTNLLKCLEVENPMFDKKEIEDDTDGAPQIELRMAGEDKVRTLSGEFWEDFRNTYNSGIRTGNGIKEKGEKPIEGLSLVLEERVSVKEENIKDLLQKNNYKIKDQALLEIKYNKNDLHAKDRYVDIPFVWPDVIKTSDGEIDIKGITKFTSKQKTDKDGKYTYTGVPAGNFVVKSQYTASSKPEDLVKTPRTDKDENRQPYYINGADFKSTLFYKGDESKKDLSWIRKNIEEEQKEKFSLLRDDEFRRMQVTKTLEKMDANISALLKIFDQDYHSYNADDALKLKNLEIVHKNTNMVATTPKINMSVEFYEKLSEDDKKNLLTVYDKAFAVPGVILKANEQNKIGYDVKDINGALVEKPKSKVVLNKHIKSIEFLTGNLKRNLFAEYKTDWEVQKPVIDQEAYYQNMPTVKFKTTLDKSSKNNVKEDSIIFQDNVYTVDGLSEPGQEKNSQGFAYLQIDEGLLQGSVINVNYGITAYNLSEVDKKYNFVEDDMDNRGMAYYTGIAKQDNGQLFCEAESDKYGFGKYVGNEYYSMTNKNLDDKDLSRVHIKTILDAVSTTATLDGKKDESKFWTTMSKTSLIGLLQGVTDQNAKDQEYIDTLHGRNVPYITENKSNIYARFIEKDNDLLPVEHYLSKINTQTISSKDNQDYKFLKEWEIPVTSTSSTMSAKGDLMYENAAELVGYILDNATRDKAELLGSIFMKKKDNNLEMFEVTATEHDSSTSEFVTITPPTGVSKDITIKNNVKLIAISVIVVVTVIGIVVYTILRKRDKKAEYFTKKPWERV